MTREQVYEEWERRIKNLQPGAHLCCIYEREEEHQAILTPYLRYGLEQGEKVLYVVDALTAQEVLSYLHQDGFDPGPCLKRGQLAILTANESYTRGGIFDPDAMISLLRAETERALDEGYSALRVTGEMSWALRGLAGSKRLIEYESKLNEFFPGSKCLAICQYDRRRFGPEILLDVLATHPVAIVGTEVFENFYYMPPQDFLGPDPVRARLDNWLASLRERKRAEEELRKLSRAVEQSPATVVITNAEGTIEYVNPKFVKLTGYTTEEAIGQNPRILKSGRQPPEFYRKLWETITRGEEWQGEFLNRKKNGDFYWESALISPIRNGEGVITHFLGVKEDITDRKLAEEALRASEHRYRSLFENTIVGIVSSGPDGRIQSANPSIARILGYQSPSELIGKTAQVIWFDPRDRSRALEEAMVLGRLEPQELVLKKKDGTPIYALVSVTINRDQQGHLMGVTATLTDVTGRKLAEDALKEAHKELERRVEERTAELAQANALLRQEIEERKRAEEALRESENQLHHLSSQLLSAQEDERKSLAKELHDSIGQSLSAIKFGTENVLKQLPKRASKEIRQLQATVSMVQSAVEEVRRIQTDLHPPTLEDLGILATISWFCREFQTIYTGIPVEQSIDIEEEDVPDPLKIVIYRVMQEALNNIAKHSHADMVRLSLKKAKGTIRLTIEDNGQGFDLKRKPPPGSLHEGIGISSMKERIELSGGSFAIESKTGRGTMIQASWPESG
jgi:PAS domain S-box-containing protein